MSREIKLGDTAQDRITGLKGIVVAITTWLNGCKRITIQPQKLHKDKPVESSCFDAEQVELVEEKTLASDSPPSGGPRPSPTRNPDPK